MIIDIVTPTYNRDAFIEKTLKSVIAQKTQSNIHYYIMDGGSTDNTINIVNQHVLESTNKNLKISLTIDNDKGMYDAIYKGFIKGNGDIMAWINSDDIYLPTALQTVEEIFELHRNVDWIIGMPAQINELDSIIGVNTAFPLKARAGIEKGIYNFKNSQRLCPTIQQDAIFWRRSLWNKLSEDFFEKFRSSKYAGDLFLWQEFAKHSGLYYVKSILSCFRKHNNQLTSDLSKYAFEMNYKPPSIKNSLISLLLNIPVIAPNVLKFKTIKKIHTNLCKSNQCGLIFWNSQKSNWDLIPENIKNERI